jgi:hypothetical protein
MRRRQLFGFNEHPKTPGLLRDAIVETLGNGFAWGNILESAAPLFAQFCRRARPRVRSPQKKSRLMR